MPRGRGHASFGPLSSRLGVYFFTRLWATTGAPTTRPQLLGKQGWDDVIILTPAYRSVRSVFSPPAMTECPSLALSPAATLNCNDGAVCLIKEAPDNTQGRWTIREWQDGCDDILGLSGWQASEASFSCKEQTEMQKRHFKFSPLLLNALWKCPMMLWGTVSHRNRVQKRRKEHQHGSWSQHPCCNGRDNKQHRKLGKQKIQKQNLWWGVRTFVFIY